MDSSIATLTITAISLGFIHTVIGPDHYLPFIVMAKARQWSNLKTFWVTLLAGLGHVASSIVLGFVGIALGIAVFNLNNFESFRGDMAAWGIIVFGFVYGAWGVRGLYRMRKHAHDHGHEPDPHHHHRFKNGHVHKHLGLHSHMHEAEKNTDITPWVLFTVFILGPCEPLIPILMYPAAENNMWGVYIVTIAFASVTVTTMLAMVFIGLLTLKPLPVARLGRYSHTLAGLTIFLCGVAIKLGL